MELMTRRKWLTMMGSLPVLGGISNLGLTRWRGARERGARVPVGSARERFQQRYLPNVPLVTHEGKRVRFYDDLVKDKKVVINLIDTHTPESATATKNLAAVQRYFGARVGRDIHMCSISFNPKDTPATLKAWVEQHEVKPGWLFLTGRQADVQRLRRALKLTFPDPAEDANRSYVVSQLRYGSEPEMRWTAFGTLGPPRNLAHHFQLDFGDDPADANPPPLWNCQRIVDQFS